MLPELFLLLALSLQTQDAPPASTRMVPLRSGDIVFGEITAHDPDGIRFKRLETGGEIHLPWGFLDPELAQALRLELGYVEAESEELLVDADRLELADGTELIGRIENRTEDHLWVKRAEGTVPVPKNLVRGSVTAVRAPALDIYTRDELYQNALFELQGALDQPGRAGAQAHDELARTCERLLDFAHALEHYEKARELDSGYDAARIDGAIARARTKAELQQQVDLLSEIDLQRARKRYDKALAGLDSFPKLYPGSALLEDWNKLRDRVAKAQERDLRDEVVSRWHHWAVRLAREAARMEGYEETLAYLEEKMSNDIAQKVAEDSQTIVPGIDADAVRRIFGERKGGKYRTATYGLGTWLLGDAARAELDQSKEEAEPKPEEGTQTAERKRLEERVKRYLENQKLARDAAEKTATEDDPQVFWKDWNWAGRAQWVLAYYAEKSGDLHDLAGRLSNCRECGGTGARDMLFSGSAIQDAKAGEVLVPCPSCHTVGVVRRIRYR